jgi:hypothetical protein
MLEVNVALSRAPFAEQIVHPFGRVALC